MENIIIEELKTEQIAETDVLVCGGGPAGVGAAIKAARLGVSVLIVEAHEALGGVATEGMMSHWGGRSSSGVLPELYERCQALNKQYDLTHTESAGIHAINHELQKIALEQMMQEAGVRILYATRVCKAVTEGDKVVGVIVENKSGRGFIRAKCTVDATGDGDVAASAGVPFFKGREEDGRMQPCTIMFKIGGVDYDRAVFPGSFETLVHTDKGELQAMAKEILPFPAGHVLLYRQPTPDTVCCNMTNAIEIDGTDGFSLTEGILTCRSQILPIIDFLHKYVPGYEKCWLMSGASLLGIRETRHFEGVASLQADDLLTARYYEDWVVRRGFFNFDVHNLTGASLDKTGVQHAWKQQQDYTIPYGCLLPKRVDGLLLSGRNISGSHMAHSNFRIMSVCIAIGEGAGVAAALAVKAGKEPREIDAKEIQQFLSE